MGNCFFHAGMGSRFDSLVSSYKILSVLRLLVSILLLSLFLPHGYVASYAIAQNSFSEGQVPGSSWKPGVPLPTVEPEAKPFWKRKKKVYRRIIEGRDVIVSVKTLPGPIKERPHRLYMQGAGLINAPREFAFAQATQFESLHKVSPRILESRYDAVRGRLFVHSKAFGYHARMMMQIEVRNKGDVREIRWRNIAGVFTGMTGVLKFSKIAKKGTELSLTADYNFLKLPIPRFFTEFGLEVVLQQVAKKMRAHIESEYKKR